MQGLLLFRRLRNPQDIVVVFSIDMPDVAGNDVVFVPGRTFEREFAFDCHSAAVRIEGGQIGTNIVFGLGFVEVCFSFAVAIDKVCPTEGFSGDSDLLEG